MQTAAKIRLSIVPSPTPFQNFKTQPEFYNPEYR